MFSATKNWRKTVHWNQLGISLLSVVNVAVEGDSQYEMILLLKNLTNPHTCSRVCLHRKVVRLVFDYYKSRKIHGTWQARKAHLRTVCWMLALDRGRHWARVKLAIAPHTALGGLPGSSEPRLIVFLILSKPSEWNKIPKTSFLNQSNELWLADRFIVRFYFHDHLLLID